MNRTSIVMKLLKTDYPNHVDTFGYKEADIQMQCIHGSDWIEHKKEIYQWYDQDYVEPPLHTDLWGNKYRGWV